jgi:hypothetical protein
MNTRQTKIKQIIARSLGVPASEEYFDYQLRTPEPLVQSAKEFLSKVPPSFGACVMLSSAWAAYLRDKLSIPAIAVAGDLKISGTKVFKYKEKLPEASQDGNFRHKVWSGHCWIEINGYLADLSVFRTAYAISGYSVLKDFVINNFGHGRGAFLCREEDIPSGMNYIPKYVLNQSQLEMYTASLFHQIEQGEYR